MMPFCDRRVLVVVAHPDDEVLFAGSQLSCCRTLWIIHTTDGVTSRRTARSKGFRGRATYGEARRRELHAALTAGETKAECRCLWFRDQSLSYHMGEAARQIGRMLRDVQPDLILTHAYEGGHLDHDATCFAVHEAVRSAYPCPIWEFAGYHAQNGRFVTSRFPDDGHQSPVLTIQLDMPQRQAKRRMLDCFTTQTGIVSKFSLDSESFRLAPDYDFAQPPFAGQLGYENNTTSPEGRLWRVVARTEQKALSGTTSERQTSKLNL